MKFLFNLLKQVHDQYKDPQVPTVICPQWSVTTEA